MPGFLLGPYTQQTLDTIYSSVLLVPEIRGNPTVDDYLIHLGTWRMPYFCDLIARSVVSIHNSELSLNARSSVHTSGEEEDQDLFCYSHGYSVVFTGLFVHRVFSNFVTWDNNLQVQNNRPLTLQEIKNTVPFSFQQVVGMPHYDHF